MSESSQQDVLFYVLNSDTQEAREAFVCKLLNKIYSQQRPTDVRFANMDDTKRFDRRLWDWQPQAFIPHAIENAMPAMIQLYSDQCQPAGNDVFINLHPEFPSFFTHYQRTIEVLDQSAHLLQMGRERWKAYKQQGIEPTVHKIGF